MNERERLEVLKDILFTDDRDYADKITERIVQLEQILHDRNKLSGKIDPIVSEQLDEFAKNIPNTLGPVITATLKEEIKHHKDEVVDALYPVLGKMIKKYIAQEMRLLSEKIDDQFSFVKTAKRKMRSFFGNVKEEDLLLSELSMAKIEQVFLIERESGILKAGYSKTETIDEELISGMLTAIKSFVEDAFHQGGQSLEHIDYELYQIHIQSFVTHYVAVVISGNYLTRSKNKVQDIIFNFYNKYMAMNLDLVMDFGGGRQDVGEPVTREDIEQELAKYFGNAKI
ncbi:MAG: cell envelope biogenesis protein OmpA [Eudoraea sp.]|nr:cell envelope biogenesis protein OmpA [Eudoraea sp.]